MSKLIPAFPLQIVVFPEETLNLHIFEPRYLEMIEYCNSQKSIFGMPVFLNNEISKFGTTIELLSVEKIYETGEIDIKCIGRNPFEVVNFYKESFPKLYPSVSIDLLNFSIENADPTKMKRIKFQFAELQDVLKTDKQIDDFYGDGLSFKLGHYLALSIIQKIKLLTIAEENERLDFIISHLDSILPILQNAEETKEKIRSNGHFRNFEAFDY